MSVQTLLRQTISVLIVAAFTIWTILFIYKNVDYFKSALRIEWLYLVPLVLLVYVDHYLNGLQFRLLAASCQVHLRRIESMALSLIASLINLVMPLRLGIGYRAYYLIRYHELPFEQFVPLMGGQVVLGFLARAVMGLMVVLLFSVYSDTFSTPLLVLFSGLTLFSIYIVFFTTFIPSKLKRTFATMIDSWEQIRRDRLLVRRFAVLVIVQILFSGLLLQFAFQAGNVSVTYAKALLLAITGAFGVLLGLTPGGIGIVEGIYLATSPLIGIPLEAMLVAALIRRAVDMVALFLISPVAWFRLKPGELES